MITGFHGTDKTTGARFRAACRRGERTMFVSFDSEDPEVSATSHRGIGWSAT